MTKLLLRFLVSIGRRLTGGPLLLLLPLPPALLLFDPFWGDRSEFDVAIPAPEPAPEPAPAPAATRETGPPTPMPANAVPEGWAGGVMVNSGGLGRSIAVATELE